MLTEFLQVRQAIRIGVLIPVTDAIVIGVLNQWICIQNIHLNAVTDAIIVGIDHSGIGFEVYFLPVT